MINELPVRVSTVLSGSGLTRLYNMLDEADVPFSLSTHRMPRSRAHYVELHCRPCDAMLFQNQLNGVQRLVNIKQSYDSNPQ